METQEYFSDNQSKAGESGSISCSDICLLNLDNENRISAFEFWCWRGLLGISWTEKRNNVSIEEQIGSQVLLTNMVMKQKLSYFGHVVRANDLAKINHA